MFIHFFCLCPLSLAIKLNFNISKEAYCVDVTLVFHQWRQRVVAWLLLYSAGEGDLLFGAVFYEYRGWGQHAVVAWPLVKSTHRWVTIRVLHWWRQRVVAWLFFARTTGEGNVLLRDCFVCTTGEGNVLLRGCFCVCHWWRQRVVVWLFCVYYQWGQRVAWLFCVPLVKATFCCVFCLAFSIGEDSVLLRDCFCGYHRWRQHVVAWLFFVFHRWRQRVVAWLFLRVPLVEATCCCVTLLRMPPVKATCCCVLVLRIPLVRGTSF